MFHENVFVQTWFSIYYLIKGVYAWRKTQGQAKRRVKRQFERRLESILMRQAMKSLKIMVVKLSLEKKLPMHPSPISDPEPLLLLKHSFSFQLLQLAT